MLPDSLPTELTERGGFGHSVGGTAVRNLSWCRAVRSVRGHDLSSERGGRGGRVLWRHVWSHWRIWLVIVAHGGRGNGGQAQGSESETHLDGDSGGC